ncbi:hypothetical protein CspeluHIS016_0301510 [Cutaneotrichosporon spelunceum]|uniref:Cleft lip and palate associated transmembrane protein n=1 Tax=Cutaneotrichosporon spelunceum TaxID=1672016 RepID=A0AAD3TTQ0_9TREE|nr:hypothetical protein CspeluHIS016_0301510 [Cutaneotrichosporon spelunceum]
MSAPRTQAAPAQDGQEQEGPGKVYTIVRTLAIFMGMQLLMKYGMSYLGMGPASTPDTPPSADGAAAAAASATVASASAPSAPASLVASPAWAVGTTLSLLLFANTAPDFSPGSVDWTAPTLRWDNITLGDWKDARAADLALPVPASVQSNGSWWMDIVLLKDGGDALGRAVGDVAHHRKEMTRWAPRRKVRKGVSLLAAKNESAPAVAVEEGPAPIISYWSRNFTVTLVGDGGSADFGAMPPAVKEHYHLAPREGEGEGERESKYFPVVFVNDFWLLKENLVPINETTTVLPLHVTYAAISHMKFNILASLTASFEQSAAQQGTGAELDEVKRMLVETNPILLVTTALVTVLHMLFEFLAFSSDVAHWRKKGRENDLVGVSLRTILTNVIVQLIILLYLHDSSEETSLMILFTQGIGLLIEAWKITKVTNVRIRPAQNVVGYKLVFEDKHVLSEDEKKTQEYDALAFRLVSYVAGPVLLAYAAYSLVYTTHKSWYSFVIATLAQAIYMFGFVQLVPQLIINYKLKSVAHIPMKAMVYKTLSTVVDDFFAFCVKMPWLHRLACFRDDVVFVILLIQRWKYRTDYSRVNEYGQLGEDDEKAVQAAKDKGELAADVETKKDK